jgi:hypothetical protein
MLIKACLQKMKNTYAYKIETDLKTNWFVSRVFGLIHESILQLILVINIVKTTFYLY